MLSLTVIIGTIWSHGPCLRHPFPTGLEAGLDQLFACDAALADDLIVNQDDGDAEVVEAVQLVVGVNVGQVGRNAELGENSQGLVAEVAALAGYQHHTHLWSLQEPAERT